MKSSPIPLDPSHANRPSNTLASAPFFSKSASSDAFFQTKLTVGKPGDKYEREADAIAEQVVNGSDGPDAILQQKPELMLQADEESLLQAQEEEEELQMQPEEEEEEELQMQPEEEEEEELQMKEDEEEELQAKSDTTPPIAGTLSAERGSGASLPAQSLAEMSGAFGADFSGVRIHTDDKAVQMNKQLGAQAFTNGSDIYFNKGKYQPESGGGKKLLAHELTHVVQQGKAPTDEKGK